MRKFYENWMMLDVANTATDPNSTIAIVELEGGENVVEVGVNRWVQYRLISKT